MEAAAGHELDDAGVGLAHQLYRETDGNPFFVAEMLRNLSESGAIYQDGHGALDGGETEGQLALPHSVRAVIGTRVSRLGEEATKVLSTASVIGRDFDLDLLAETTAWTRTTSSTSSSRPSTPPSSLSSLVLRPLQLLSRPRPAHPL